MVIFHSSKFSFFSIIFSCLLFFNVSLTIAATGPSGGENHLSNTVNKHPKLTVLLFVDQVRFDQSLEGRYPEFKGFKRHPGGAYDRFFQRGVVFDYSEYQHAANYTTQGWGTVSTGGNPHYNKLPHAVYYEYNKQGQSAKFGPMDGIKTGAIVEPVPINGEENGAFKISSGGKLTLIKVRETKEKKLSIQFQYKDADGRTRLSPVYGTRWSDRNDGWTDIPADIIGKVIYYSAGQALDRLELFDNAGNLIYSGGSPVGNLVATEHVIEGDIVGAKGHAGWWIDKLAFTTANQWPGSWALTGEIKTINDSFATQFPGSKVFSIGDWSYPVAMFSGKQGKGFWLGDSLNNQGAKGHFTSNTYMYPDTNKDGQPDLPSWMSNYSTQNGSVAKRTLDALTDLSGNPWRIAKCDTASHDSNPCWKWDTLYSRTASNYVNYPYDDDNRGDAKQYEVSKSTCGLWKRPGQDFSFPYEVGTQPAGVSCPVTVNGGPGAGWQHNVYQNMLYGPHSINVVTDAARHIITTQQLGQDDTPDLLIVYTGALDRVGHVFGIDSIEYEDVFYRIDKALGELMGWIDTEVGRDNVFYALTGDHGMDSIPEYQDTNPPHLQKFHNEKNFSAGRLMVASIEQSINQSIISTLKHLTRKSALSHNDYVIDIVTPTIYLDLDKIRLEMCDGDELDANLHRQTPGGTEAHKASFDGSFCRDHDLLMGSGTDLIDTVYMKNLIDAAVIDFNGNNLPTGALAGYSYSTIQAGNKISNLESDTQPGHYDDQTNTLARLIENMYVHGRSGQIYVVPKPHYYYYHSEGYGAMHSTPYWYDRYTTLMYLGGATEYLPNDLRHVRNLAYAQSLGDNAFRVNKAGLRTQQHNIAPTLGRIMGIDYENMPQAYRNRVHGEGTYNSAYRLLTHLYRDDDYMRIRFYYGGMCLYYSSGSEVKGSQCDNSYHTAWHYDFTTKQLKNKQNVCLQAGSADSTRIVAANCVVNKSRQRFDLLPRSARDERSQGKHFLLRPEGSSRSCVVPRGNLSLTLDHCQSNYSYISLENHDDSVGNTDMTHGPMNLVLSAIDKYRNGNSEECLNVQSGLPSSHLDEDSCSTDGSIWHLDRGMLKHVPTGQCLDADEPLRGGGESSALKMVDCGSLAFSSSEPGKRQARIVVEVKSDADTYNAVYSYYHIKRISANGNESYIRLAETGGTPNKRWKWTSRFSDATDLVLNRAN